MIWNIDFHPDFYSEFIELPDEVRLELLARNDHLAKLMEQETDDN
jgi:hypothetical protein